MRYIITLAFASTAAMTPAFAEVPKVVTDIPPVHALVAEVMGDLGQPELLLARGADEHDFQLRPSQAASVAEADLVVWIGPELTPWLDSALTLRPTEAAALALLGSRATETRVYGEPTKDHGHDDHDHAHDDHAHDEHAHDDHGHDHGHDHDHAHDHGHKHDGVDPHAWLDPGNASAWLGLIAVELSRLDPDNAETYLANADAAAERIAALDAEVAAILAPVKDLPIVTFHDAYGYFASHFGLNMAGSIALGDASSPGAQRLKQLRDDLKAGAALCIFPEAQHDPALVVQMAEGTDVRIGGVLDPVGSTLEPGPDAYAALLKGMAETFADCLTEGT